MSAFLCDRIKAGIMKCNDFCNGNLYFRVLCNISLWYVDKAKYLSIGAFMLCIYYYYSTQSVYCRSVRYEQHLDEGSLRKQEKVSHINQIFWALLCLHILGYVQYLWKVCQRDWYSISSFFFFFLLVCMCYLVQY